MANSLSIYDLWSLQTGGSIGHEVTQKIQQHSLPPKTPAQANSPSLWLQIRLTKQWEWLLFPLLIGFYSQFVLAIGIITARRTCKLEACQSNRLLEHTRMGKKWQRSGRPCTRVTGGKERSWVLLVSPIPRKPTVGTCLLKTIQFIHDLFDCFVSTYRSIMLKMSVNNIWPSFLVKVLSVKFVMDIAGI